MRELAAQLVVYAYGAFCLQLVARKTDEPREHLAWVPIGNLYLMCEIGGQPGYWMIFMMLPLVGTFFFKMIGSTIGAIVCLLIGAVCYVIVCMGIAQARGKATWLGVPAAWPVFYYIGLFVLELVSNYGRGVPVAVLAPIPIAGFVTWGYLAFSK